MTPSVYPQCRNPGMFSLEMSGCCDVVEDVRDCEDGMRAVLAKSSGNGTGSISKS